LIEVRCFDSFAAAASLRDDVNELNRLSARPDPFSTFEFFENFFRHDEYAPEGHGFRLWFLTAFDAGRLIGYLALKRVTPTVLGIETATLSFFVTHDTDRPHLVAKPERVGEVCEAFYAYLLTRKREWSLLELQQQDDASPLFPPPPSVPFAGYRLGQWPSLENCTIPVRWGTLREYYRALAKKFRSNLARQMRLLLAAGDVQLLTSSDPSVTPALLELYCSIERHSWKSQAKASVGRHPKRIEYVRGLLAAEQPMRITIQLLLLDGVPIAGLINGAFMRGLYALHVVYDDRASRLAPGSAMLLLGMRQAIGGGYAFFNLLSGFGYFKARWLADVTATRIAQMYRRGTLLFWRRTLGDVKRRISKASSVSTRQSFNPARRDVQERWVEEAALDGALALETGPGEREHIDALVAAIRKGRGEFLCKAELAAAMPFDAERAASASPVPVDMTLSA
jgi:hypothetical protein